MRGIGLSIGLTTLVWLGASITGPAEAGVVLGISTGESRLSTGDFEGDDRGFKIFGGYRWQDVVGIEAQYVDLGEMDDRINGIEARAKVQNLDLFLVGALPIRSLELFGKAGIAYSDIETVAESGGTEDPLDEEDGVDLAYGIGAAFRIRTYLSFRAEIERFEISGTDKVELVSFGLDIRF